MSQAELDIWCTLCGKEWGFVVFNTDGQPETHACPHCGARVTAAVVVRHEPVGVSVEGASWAMEAKNE